MGVEVVQQCRAANTACCIRVRAVCSTPEVLGRAQQQSRHGHAVVGLQQQKFRFTCQHSRVRAKQQLSFMSFLRLQVFAAAKQQASTGRLETWCGDAHL